MDTNLFDGMMNSTELHEAAAGDVERVRHLLAEGADVDARDMHQHTPLMDACTAHMAEMRGLTKKLGQALAEPPTGLIDP